MTKGLRQLRRARAEKLLVVGDREIQLDPRSQYKGLSQADRPCVVVKSSPCLPVSSDPRTGADARNSSRACAYVRRKLAS
jgi:hypothetical protein